MEAKSLHVDVPVTLTDLKIVFSIGALALEGDLPAPLFHLQRTPMTLPIGTRGRTSSPFSRWQAWHALSPYPRRIRPRQDHRDGIR